MEKILEPESETPVVAKADVVVAGGGLSGVAAAVAATRSGANVLMLEQHAFPGGTSTAALMSGITNFYVTRRDQQVVRGIAEEVLRRLVASEGVGLGPFTRRVPQIPNDPEKMKLVLIELLEDAGVRVLYHSRLAAAQVIRGKVNSAIVENKAGRSAIVGQAFVDATGDADLVWRAGGEVERVGANGSLEMRMANVDLDTLCEYFIDNPSEYDEYGDVETSLADFAGNWREKGILHIPHGNGTKMSLVQRAVSEGRYARECGAVVGMDAFGMYAFRGTGTVIVNTGFLHGDLLDPFVLSKAESEARKAARIAADFLITNMPGFERSFLVETGSELGIRVARRIIGRYMLTRAECEAFSRFPDVIAVATERRMGGPRYEEGFDIPYGIMVPISLKGVLVASGKAVSTDPAGLLRAQVACMQLGQASGVAAAAAARLDRSPGELDVRAIQRQLLAQGVYLGDDQRLLELGPA